MNHMLGGFTLQWIDRWWTKIGEIQSKNKSERGLEELRRGMEEAMWYFCQGKLNNSAWKDWLGLRFQHNTGQCAVERDRKMPIWMWSSLNWCCIPHCVVRCVQTGNCAKNHVGIWDSGLLMALLGPIGLSFHAAQNCRNPCVKTDFCSSPFLNQRQSFYNVSSWIIFWGTKGLRYYS